MNLSQSALLLWALQISATSAFAPAKSFSTGTKVQGSTTLQMSSEVQDEKVSKKQDRLRFMKSPSFYRRGFKEVREGVEKNMEEEYKSTLVDEMKQKEYIMKRDGVTVHLAKVRGL